MLGIESFIEGMDIAAQASAQALRQAGGKVFLVGGAVRDFILDQKPKDYDILVQGLTSPDVKKALQGIQSAKVNLVGQAFGIYLVQLDYFTCEIALPRTEMSVGVGHQDFTIGVKPDLPIQEDLARRDFTANAMAIDLQTMALIDPYGGAEDVSNRILTLVNPVAFEEDPLRIVRALVAYSVNGLYPDDATKAQMTASANKIRHLPHERIQMEMDKLLTGANPSGAIRLANDTGVLPFILPELAESMGVDQKSPYHDLDVGNHQIKVMDNLTKTTDDPDLRLVGLIHDIGKPDSMWEDDNGVGHFYEHPDHPDSADHAALGAKYAEQLLRRLSYPNTRINRITEMIRNHMFSEFNSAKGARKFLAMCNGDPKLAFDLLTFKEADQNGVDNPELGEPPEKFERMRELLRQVIDQQQGVTVKDLAINGRDLLDIGVPPGPQMGQILNSLVDQIIETPEINNKEDLLTLARGMM
jgi:tRNA nucleotidyltransferase (CCA-adding enzyme)